VLITGVLIAVGRPTYKHRRDTIIGPRHRIRMESRALTFARRADEKENVKVAAITVPLTVVLTSLFCFLLR
jgi:hypothetical protein